MKLENMSKLELIKKIKTLEQNYQDLLKKYNELESEYIFSKKNIDNSSIRLALNERRKIYEINLIEKQKKIKQLFKENPNVSITKIANELKMSRAGLYKNHDLMQLIDNIRKGEIDL